MKAPIEYASELLSQIRCGHKLHTAYLLLKVYGYDDRAADMFLAAVYLEKPKETERLLGILTAHYTRLLFLLEPRITKGES